MVIFIIQLINCPGIGMIFNIVGVSLFYKAGGHGRGGDGHDEDDHMILSGVFMDTVADTLASLVVLVSALGRAYRQQTISIN